MEALEPLAGSLGYDRIRLHVFGHNAVARNLYPSGESAGGGFALSRPSTKPWVVGET
jgi:hypothetical protein